MQQLLGGRVVARRGWKDQKPIRILERPGGQTIGVPNVISQLPYCFPPSDVLAADWIVIDPVTEGQLELPPG